MGSAVVWSIEDIRVPGFHMGVVGDDGFNRFAHRSEVDREVGGVGDEFSGGVEHCATEVEAFFDVHRYRSVFENNTHLFSDVHKKVVKDL